LIQLKKRELLLSPAIKAHLLIPSFNSIKY
jgi:hypothetical protein